VQTLSPLIIDSTVTQASITGVDATAVDQVVTGSIPQVSSSQTIASNLAFITYSGSTASAKLPYYIPAAGPAPGAFNYVTFAGASAVTLRWSALSLRPHPLLRLYCRRQPDPLHQHSTTVNATTPPKDIQQISPNLPPASRWHRRRMYLYGHWNHRPATAIGVRPRATT